MKAVTRKVHAINLLSDVYAVSFKLPSRLTFGSSQHRKVEAGSNDWMKYCGMIHIVELQEAQGPVCNKPVQCMLRLAICQR